ncbi:MAG: RcpC/CpaB family pilus assembly protein, partial [Streptosporangiaceae bacterium]
VLAPSDLASTDVRVDDVVYQAAVPEDALSSAVGKQLSEPVHAHQLLVRAQLSGLSVLGPGESAMTIPITPTNAAGDHIQPGDSVKIVATSDKGHPDSKTTIILPRVRVYDVGYGESTSITAGSGSSSRGPVASLTLIVNDDQAVILGQARWNSDLDALLLPPASQS